MSMLRISSADWLSIGLETGWYQSELRKEAALIDSLRTMLGKEPQIGQNFLQQIQNLPEMKRGIDPTGKKQWFDGFLARMTSIGQNISADLKALDDLASKDQRVTGIAAMLRQLQHNITNSLPQMKVLQEQLSTELTDTSNVDQMMAEIKQTYQTGGMNIPIGGHPAVPTM